MGIVNLNKLFPRLTIRAKLTTAFLLLALMPLAVVAAVTTQVTITRLRRTASEGLQREVEASQAAVALALSRVEQDVEFLRDAYLVSVLQSREPLSAGSEWAIREFLDHAPFLFRVKAITPDGVTRFEAGPPSGPGGDGYYYVFRAEKLGALDRLSLPVEVLSVDPLTKAAQAVPAVATLIPLRNNEGDFLGVVVGEAYASTLFSSLERMATILPEATTGLLDPSGRFLYHSDNKRTWESLLGPAADETLPRQLLSLRGSGSPARAGGYLVSARLIRLGPEPEEELTVFRMISLRVVDGPIRSFLFGVILMGGSVLLVVLGLALVAARQLTQPIYQLHRAANQLASGADPEPLHITTNDELEDFAENFEVMARALVGRRRQLEEKVSERTQELVHLHSELSGLVTHSGDAIISLDAGGTIRGWNQGAEHLLGWSRTEVMGRSCIDVLAAPAMIHPSERGFLERELARRGAIVDFQTRRLAKDGTPLRVSLTQTAVIGPNGNQVGSSMTLRDVSVREDLEQHMRRSERLAAMSVMAAGLAHEINNPIAIIGNRLEVMEAELQDLGQGALLNDVEVLRGHTRRLADLTSNLLRFARDPEESQGPIALVPIAERVRDLLAPTFETRNVRVTLSSTGEGTIVGVTSAVETVFLNLLLNAADAMLGGGEVDVTIDHEMETVRIVVADTGPGVPKELRERIFEPFFTTKDSRRGTGLGLSLCRSIVERLRGRIWVEHAPGKGARFVVLLPHAGGPSA